mgnify:CR=1 FL=1
MEVYEYAKHKQSVEEQSAKVIAQIRKKYQKNLEMYQYTEKGLQTMEHQLINELEEQLLQLRNGFITVAEEKTQDTKRKLVEKRMQQQPKTQGEQLCEYMKFFKQIEVYKSIVQANGADIELLNTLATDDDISRDVFEVVKGAMIQVVPQEEKANYRSLKKVDTAMSIVNADINDLERIKNNVNAPVVGLEFADQTLYQMVTQKELSNYYFEDKHTEEVI